MYKLRFPGVIVFGDGVLNQLPELVGAADGVLLVTGASARRNGLQQRLSALLAGHRVVAAPPVAAEPTTAMVDALLSVGRANRIDTVVAVGGGSVIDAAKTAAILLPTGESVQEYFWGRRAVPVTGARLIAAPTTAGTGAEITPNAVLTDPVGGVKQSVRGDGMFAAAALIDPELTASCPRQVAAASGMDALTQGIEAYLSARGNAVSRALARAGVELLLPHLRRAVLANDATARGAVAEGCLLGAMAFTQSGLGAVHGLAHPLGCLLGLGHGETCAILLPEILRWNRDVAAERMAELSPDLIAEVEALRAELGLPENFRSRTVTSDDRALVVKQCRSGSMSCNPRQLSDADVMTILERLT